MTERFLLFRPLIFFCSILREIFLVSFFSVITHETFYRVKQFKKIQQNFLIGDEYGNKILQNIDWAFHKLRNATRGRGFGGFVTFNIFLFGICTVSHYEGNGVKNLAKLRFVVYGRPH